MTQPLSISGFGYTRFRNPQLITVFNLSKIKIIFVKIT